jgi:indolepyruvate ferredoxin oxidoreductase alpha subunit
VLVIDASVALPACTSSDRFSLFGDEQLVAPPLLWSEARSALHEALWRREILTEEARTALGVLEAAPVRPRSHPRLGAVAWQLADELGWAKTYDAEYLGLASLLSCRLVTLDARLHRGASRLGYVIAPGDL